MPEGAGTTHGLVLSSPSPGRTGEARKVPVIPVEVGGSRYLVSPYGESDWVRNLRLPARAN